ncbi:hypothetical protein [Pseudoalteromonas phenolica]|nr:hypothetical protein [Pseudoalteromonas phenolica]
MKQPLYKYVYRLWSFILALGLVLSFQISAYLEGRYLNTELLICTGILAAIAIWCGISIYRSTTKLAATAYENGLEVPGKGFFQWDELKVTRERYVKRAPSVNFIPCYYIRLGYDQSTAIFQYLEDYTGLYHLLYKKGVEGADKELLIYNTNIEGIKMEWKPVYKAIFNPKTGELLEEEGNPLERQSS